MLSRRTGGWLGAPVVSATSQGGRGAAEVELTVGKAKESEFLGLIEAYGHANELDMSVTREAHVFTTAIYLEISGDLAAIKDLEAIVRREADSSVRFSWLSANG
jgi:hypothetical protein